MGYLGKPRDPSHVTLDLVSWTAWLLLEFPLLFEASDTRGIFVKKPLLNKLIWSSGIQEVVLCSAAFPDSSETVLVRVRRHVSDLSYEFPIY
jgi:hypothetical protein